MSDAHLCRCLLFTTISEISMHCAVKAQVYLLIENRYICILYLYDMVHIHQICLMPIFANVCCTQQYLKSIYALYCQSSCYEVLVIKQASKILCIALCFHLKFYFPQCTAYAFMYYVYI